MTVVQKNLTSRAWAELLLLGLIWGASFLSIRVALDEIGPLTAVAHRTFWAMCVLWGVVILRGHTIPVSLRMWGAFLVMGLLNNAIPFSLMAWGQLHIETGLTAILNAGTAIFGIVVAALFLADERLSLRKSVGVLLGFLGVATAVGLSALLQFDIRSLAQFAVIGGTISYAFAGVWARKTLSSVAPQVAAAGMLTGASLIAVPMAWFVEGPITLHLQPATWAAIGYYAIIATAFAYLLFFRLLAAAGSGNVMVCTLLVAPVSIVLGAIFLGENLPLNAYKGFLLLAIGLLLIDGRIVEAVQNRLRRA